MTKCVLVVFLTSWFMQSFALTQPQLVDSLQQQLKAHPTADTTRLRLLNQLARPLAFDNVPRSRVLANEAFRLAQHLRNPSGEALALGNLAFGYAQAREADRAVLLAQRALAIATRINDPNLLALTNNALGYAQYILFAPGAATTLQRAEASARRVHNLSEQAFAYNLLGRISSRKADYGHALDYSLKALTAARQVGDSRQTALANFYLSSLYQNIQDYAQALIYARQSVAVARQARLLSVLSAGLNGLGDCYRLQGNYPAATRVYQENINLSTSLGDWSRQSVSRANLADVYDRQGQYVLALTTVGSAVDTLMHHQPMGQALSFLSWARVVQARVLLHIGQVARALPIAQAGYTDGETLNNLESKRNAAEVLALVYARLGDYAQAYRYQLLYKTHQDSMSSDVLRLNVAAVQFKIELSRKQAQISLLGAQQAQQAEDVRRQRWALLISLIGLVLVGGSLAITYRNDRQKQRANARLQEAYQNVEQLSRMGQQITANLNVESIVRSLYHSVGQLMDAALLGIGTVDTARQRLNFPASVERGQRLPPYYYTLDEKRLAVRCALNDEEIVITDYQQERQQYADYNSPRRADNETQSLVYLPLRVNERVIGVLTVQSFRPGAYTDNQRNLLRNLANYAAVALANADAYGTLNQTLQTLQTTQTQLIQAEKMASLGELTAGIAHEIQNPLNFVTNFAEVSAELIEELAAEQQKPDRDTDLQTKLADDLRQNMGIIAQHGNRASRIVKGMLEHSRLGTGQKEPTNLNALADEYLRLAYHGLRAKDNGFNAELITHFDPDLGTITIVPQDMGRVFLNLFNNAFYAVAQRQKQVRALADAPVYKPAVTIRTQKLSNGVIISVRDNGEGIPDTLLAKIFQPFFTTKPSGQGTGLGLSLSYDIVTKGHGGEIHVDSREGAGTEFVVWLPWGQPPEDGPAPAGTQPMA